MDAFSMVGIFILFAIVVPASMLLIPYALTAAGVKPQRPSRVKGDTYECGMRTIGGSWVRFNFRYYYFALSFLVFSVVAVFLLPRAVRAKELQWLGFGAAIVFVATAGVALVYQWRRKTLEW